MADQSRVRVGDLLVAAPTLLDPNFSRTVVLMLDSDQDGAMGVVLNRPSTVPVADVLPDWGPLARPRDVLFSGGPVAKDAALAVGASTTYGMDPNVEHGGFRRLFDDIGMVDLDTPVPVAASLLTHLRVFAGYAGWGEEQLRWEIHAGSWYVVPSLPEDLFGGEPEGLWSRVLHRQPGDLAWVTTRPEDPSMN